MSIVPQLNRFFVNKRWHLDPAVGSPQTSSDPKAPLVAIPKDILEFYEFCGGLRSNVVTDEDLILSISSPSEFSWALPLLLDERFEVLYPDFEHDISRYWYLLGRGDTDEFFAIDLSAFRFERCYFVNLYFFGQSGKIPIIANSFSDFLDLLYIASERGERWSWYDIGLGDAYDVS